MAEDLWWQMLTKFTNRSIGEYVFRICQHAWNAYDRLHLTTNNGNNSRHVHKNLELGTFFVSKEEITRISSVYAQMPESRRTLLQRADKICGHRFDLLGFKDLLFDQHGKINWHYDPVNDATLPPKWWQMMLDPSSHRSADPKIIWEINRHQHLVILAQAFVISGDDRYLKEIITQLGNWMDANPPKYGINWTSSLELSYRLIAWLWVWFLCGGVDTFGSLTNRFIEFLGLQANHIEHNLSIYYSPNTHLTGEALGLYYVGVLLPELKGATRWRDIGNEWLLRCLDEHVLSDGGYMERALWYHRYTFDIYLHFYLLSQINDILLPASVKEGVKALGRFILGALRPDRKLPHIGDDDGGRLLALDGLPGDDPRGILNILGVLFNCGECAFLSDTFSEEALWLLGSNAPQVRRQAPKEKSRIFEESGYAFLRTGWSDDAVYVNFDCGPHGWLNGGHAHADMLSVEVHAGRQAIIIDPGTFSYEEPWRNWFRGSESHSVILLDGIFPASPEGFFHWEKESRMVSVKHSFAKRIEYVTGTMDTGSWQHSREIYFFLKPQLIVLLDTINCTGNHEIEVRFSLADTHWHIGKNDFVCRSTLAERVCSIQCETGGFHQTKLIDGWKSVCYGSREKTYILVFTLRKDTPVTLGTLIDLSGNDYTLRRLRSKNNEFFEIGTRLGNRKIATVQSSLTGEVVCATFFE